MRRLFTGITIAGAMLLGVATNASADTFTFNFCPAAGTQCTNAGVTQVQASFTEIAAGGDPNDYNVLITVTGGVASGYYDELLLAIGSLKYPDDYESASGLTASSGAVYTGPESDGLPGCGEAPASENALCYYTNNVLGSPTGGTTTFSLTVNLGDTEDPISLDTLVNLRFQIENSTGGNLAIFSPNFVSNSTTTSTTTTTTTTTNNTTTSPSTVPEPGILALLGAGFGAAAQRLRRRRNG